MKPVRVTSKETNIHYLSKNVQNEFAYFLSKKIQDYILEQLWHAKYYCIILDCKYDVSHTEQVVVHTGISALLPLRYHIEKVYDALYELETQDEKLNAFGRNSALGLAKKLQTFKSLCCLATWQDILHKTNIQMRSDEGVNNVITNTMKLTEEIGVVPKFEKEMTVGRRK
ncbi:hypothetical protein QYM36_010239 [Artemia franciscana]|uniref:Uncharacterized protein n=1 Tax=Artemia franciscana TaxID=6661 RepID=A0AA88L790_ARTSF|nr:hypothetical protein QYM36_010239 [Artemia franciscana]